MPYMVPEKNLSIHHPLGFNWHLEGAGLLVHNHGSAENWRDISAVFEAPMTFHYTDSFIGILTLAYYNHHIIG